MNVDSPGFFPDMSESDYHADPAPAPSLSSSIAKVLIGKSPLHAWTSHPRLGGSIEAESSEEMDFGELGHKLLLGKGAEIVVAEDFENWKKDAAKEFRATHRAEGKIVCLPKTRDRAQAMVAAILKQLPAMGLGYITQDGQSEVCGFWKEGAAWCRFMADRLIIDEKKGRAEIWDWKTMSQSAHPRACAARIASMSYDLQRAHYIQGVQALRPDLAGRITHRFIFVETAPPFAVTPVDLDGEWATVGVSKFMRALAKWQECTASGIWPGYGTEVQRLEAPPWALAAEMGAG